jgi:drug/metabolite transporter (DMT)-like permease
MNYLIFGLIIFAVIGSIIYHISEKSISNNKLNPLFYVAISAVITFVIFASINIITGTQIFNFSWSIFIISLCNAVIDVTIIYIYKQGGKISLITNIQNSLPAISLVFIGILFFSEVITIYNFIGVLIALFGISLIVGNDEDAKQEGKKININYKKLILLLGLVVVAEVAYQVSFKIASGETETLSAITTIFFLNSIEYLFLIAIISLKKNISFIKNIKKIGKGLQTSVLSMPTYLFALANLIIILSDYLIYKNGGEVSKVINYIAPLETVALAVVGILLYKEHLVRKNIFGIVLVIIGITLLST